MSSPLTLPIPPRRSARSSQTQTSSRTDRSRRIESCSRTGARLPLRTSQPTNLPPWLAALLVVASGLAAIAWSAPAQAQFNRPIGLSARMAGMGDAGRSTAIGYDALQLNPAAMSQVFTYEMETGYLYDGRSYSHAPTVGIVDSATNQNIAVGVSYTYWNAGNDDSLPEAQASQIRAAISSGFRSSALSAHVGVGMRWLDLDVANGTDNDSWGIDAGVLLTFADMLRVAVVGHNLLNTEPAYDMPRSLGVGASIMYESFLFAVDTVVDFDSRDEAKAGYHIGAQYVLMDMIPVRLGFIADRVTETNSMTGGIGFWTPEFGIDVGYQHNVEHVEDFRVGLDIRVYVP